MFVKENIKIFILIFSIIGVFFFFLINIYGVEKKIILQEKKTNTITSNAVKNENIYLEKELKEVQNPKIIKSPGVLGTTINLILSLLFVIGLIYIVMIALKYFYVKTSIPIKSGGVIHVLAKEQIDTKKSIYIVEIPGRILVIGGSESYINVLSEIEDKENIEEIKRRADEYITKYRIKKEKNFSNELKETYIKQSKNLVNKGTKVIDKIRKKIKNG